LGEENLARAPFGQCKGVAQERKSLRLSWVSATFVKAAVNWWLNRYLFVAIAALFAIEDNAVVLSRHVGQKKW
jgi:hypothetical protein